MAPRRLHAGAWWMWATGLVVAATQVSNPLVLGSILAVCGLTVATRRSDSGWARGYRAYLLVAVAIVLLRTGFRIALGGDFGTRVIAQLPRLSLPVAGGVTFGGPVTLEELLAGFYGGLRLGTIVVCVGAANTLADPRRLVGSLPRVMGALATSVVVALSLAPQLVESFLRVKRARRLRGESGTGWRAVRSLLVPVLEDSLHRSLALAASMDSRGYGRWKEPTGRPTTQLLLWTGVAAISLGMFTLLTRSGVALPVLALAAGFTASAVGLYRLGRGLARTRYRPDPWAGTEWMVAATGLVAAAGTFLAGIVDPAALHPSLQPLTWPAADPVALAAVAVAALPALTVPSLPRPSAAVGRVAS